MLALASPIALSAVLTAFMNIWNIWVMAVSLVESDGVGLSPMLSAKSWIFSTCFCISLPIASAKEIGRAHVCTPVTNAHLVCRLLLEKIQNITDNEKKMQT